jgi:methyl-accepting chemotaxis protein
MQFEDLNKNILLFNKAYNVSSENSLKFVSALSEISNESLASQENMFLIAKAAQEAYGIPLPRLMRDLGNISENVRATFHGSSEELIEQAAQLIKINSSLNDAASSAKNLLNFQTSFQSELKASALLGQRLNLNEARRLFFQGKLAEGQEELLNQLRSIGGLEDKNYFQRQAIADAMGMSLEQLQKMETSDKNLLEIQSKFPELYKEQLDAQKELDELLGSDEDRRKRELEDLAKKDVFITKSKIAAELTKRIFQNLGKLTEPLVSGLYDGYIVILEWTEAFTRLSFKVDDFTENLKTLGKAFLTIAVPIVSIYGIYRLLSKPSSPSSGGFFKGLGGKLKGVGGFFKSMFSIPLTSILKFSAALVALSVGIGSLGYALQQFKTVPDPEKLGKILALVGAYGAVIAGLGTLLTGPQGLVALAVAVAIPASIALLGGALYTLAEAFVRFKDANLSEIGPNLVSIAKGIGMLYLGSGFGTILLVPVIWGLSKSISSIGKTAEKYAGNISSLGTGFKDLTTSLLNLADNKERIKSVFDLLESIDDIGDFNGNLTLDISEDTKKSILELNTSNENLKELINTLKQNNDELKQMFEQLIDNMNVNFNVDGTSVISALATAKNRRGSSSTLGIF